MTAPPGPAALRWSELVGPAAPIEPDRAPRHRRDHAPAPAHAPRPSALAARWAREVLPLEGGTVLDVGCGAGRAALALVPPASELIGVDRDPDLLAAFADAARRAGVARRTVAGDWPDVAPDVPVADVVISHDVLYGVADVVPFVVALTARARLAVVVEVPARHPDVAWDAAWRALRDDEPAPRPDHVDLQAVVREIGLDPEVAVESAPPHHPPADPALRLAAARRRLGLAAERDGELGRWLADHEPHWVDEVAVLRWPGMAEPG